MFEMARGNRSWIHHQKYAYFELDTANGLHGVHFGKAHGKGCTETLAISALAYAYLQCLRYEAYELKGMKHNCVYHTCISFYV